MSRKRVAKEDSFTSVTSSSSMDSATRKYKSDRKQLLGMFTNKDKNVKNDRKEVKIDGTNSEKSSAVSTPKVKERDKGRKNSNEGKNKHSEKGGGLRDVDVVKNVDKNKEINDERVNMKKDIGESVGAGTSSGSPKSIIKEPDIRGNVSSDSDIYDDVKEQISMEDRKIRNKKENVVTNKEESNAKNEDNTDNNTLLSIASNWRISDDHHEKNEDGNGEKDGARNQQDERKGNDDKKLSSDDDYDQVEVTEANEKKDLKKPKKASKMGLKKDQFVKEVKEKLESVKKGREKDSDSSDNGYTPENEDHIDNKYSENTEKDQDKMHESSLELRKDKEDNEETESENENWKKQGFLQKMKSKQNTETLKSNIDKPKHKRKKKEVREARDSSSSESTDKEIKEIRAKRSRKGKKKKELKNDIVKDMESSSTASEKPHRTKDKAMNNIDKKKEGATAKSSLKSQNNFSDVEKGNEPDTKEKLSGKTTEKLMKNVPVGKNKKEDESKNYDSEEKESSTSDISGGTKEHRIGDGVKVKDGADIHDVPSNSTLKGKLDHAGDNKIPDEFDKNLQEKEIDNNEPDTETVLLHKDIGERPMNEDNTEEDNTEGLNKQESDKKTDDKQNNDVEKTDKFKDSRAVREEALKATEISFQQMQNNPSSDEQFSDNCSEIAELFDEETTSENQRCPLCNNQYEYPILLNCAHTFCRECVSLLVENSDGLSFQCPTCVTDIKLTDGEEELFCPDFILLQHMRRTRAGETGCINCRKKQAESICEDCVELYCAECADQHRQRKLTKQHRISDISSVEDPKKLKKRYFCPKHKKQQLTVYCLSCNLSVCKKCAIEEHAGEDHDCGAVIEAAEASRQILANKTKIFENEQGDIIGNIENISTMLNGLDDELDEMKAEIKQSIENLITSLRERESQLYEEVERKHNTIRDALLVRKQNLELANSQTSHMGEFLKELLQHDNEIEMLQMSATLSKRTRELEEEIYENEVTVDYDFIFDSKENNVKRQINKHGGITVKDRISGQNIIVEGFSDLEGVSQESESESETIKTWSPTNRRKDKHADDYHRTQKEGRHKDVEKQIKKDIEETEIKQKEYDKNEPKFSDNDVNIQHIKEADQTNTRQDSMFMFSGDKELHAESLSQLVSDKGEHISNLKFNVKNHKNQPCEVDVKMICPDKSIVSAHVTENTDGGFTIFFCPEIKRDFNCFISIGGKHFKKERKVLNFYGDFQGMRSKEIDLACRTISLLRWHITPGLLEKKHGMIRRSRKFLKMKTK